MQRLVVVVVVDKGILLVVVPVVPVVVLSPAQLGGVLQLDRVIKVVIMLETMVQQVEGVLVVLVQTIMEEVVVMVD